MLRRVTSLAIVLCHVPHGSCTRKGGMRVTCVTCVGCAAMTWKGGGGGGGWKVSRDMCRDMGKLQCLK